MVKLVLVGEENPAHGSHGSIAGHSQAPVAALR
jgi:hypothetical protein